jgi:hypothetical protein
VRPPLRWCEVHPSGRSVFVMGFHPPKVRPCRQIAQCRLTAEMPLYDWFMPLLHLDARSDLVQCIKLCEHIAGIEGLMRDAMAKRPKLPEVGLSRAA